MCFVLGVSVIVVNFSIFLVEGHSEPSLSWYTFNIVCKNVRQTLIFWDFNLLRTTFNMPKRYMLSSLLLSFLKSYISVKEQMNAIRRRLNIKLRK